MTVSTQFARFDSLSLDSGAKLVPVQVAYETYGELNAAKSNAILLLHAFSGDAHATGISAETGRPAWLERRTQVCSQWKFSMSMMSDSLRSS